MRVLGITGGVGAGKSTVLEYLEKRWGARVIQADAVGKMLQMPGQVCYGQILELFGQGILQKDKSLDRAALAALVFADEKRLEQINRIVHPAVKQYIRNEIQKERERGQVPFVVVEAALLLEDHYEEICDEIWYVHADRGARISRLMKARGYSLEKTEKIMENQLTEEEYRKSCDFVIDNSRDFVENTYGQIDKGLIEHGFL